MPKFKISLSTNFVGTDEELYIECDEMPKDGDLQAYAEEWAGISWEVEEITPDDPDYEDETFEDWN